MNSSLCWTVLKIHELVTDRRILERMEELNSSQWLSRDELLSIQRSKVQHLVEYAFQYVPYYQRTFKAIGFHPQDLRKDLTNLSKLPVLTKATIRENWNDLLTAESERRRNLSKISTSGSTGQPFNFMQDNDFRDYVTADIQHNMGWAGWKLGDLHAFIWGAPIKPTRRKKLRAQLIDWTWNRFKLDAFSMNDQSMAVFADSLTWKKAKFLFGYASSIYKFARFIRQNYQYQDTSLNGVFTTSELLLPSMRQYIEETFRCKVFDRYGTLELGGVACECQAHTGLHVSILNNYIEVLQNGTQVNSGEVGDLVITNLNNLGMPFIRYNIGDTGSLNTDFNCPCGRKSFLINLEGRTGDSFFTRDGRTIWAGFLRAVFNRLAHPAIKQFKVIQKTLDKIIVCLVLEGEIPQYALDEISQAIRTTLGDDIQVFFEYQDEIPTLPSGKHQYAISELHKT